MIDATNILARLPLELQDRIFECFLTSTRIPVTARLRLAQARATQYCRPKQSFLRHAIHRLDRKRIHSLEYRIQISSPYTYRLDVHSDMVITEVTLQFSPQSFYLISVVEEIVQSHDHQNKSTISFSVLIDSGVRFTTYFLNLGNRWIMMRDISIR